MSAIDLNRMSGLSFEGMKPRRQHVSALGGRRFGVHPAFSVHEIIFLFQSHTSSRFYPEWRAMMP